MARNYDKVLSFAVTATQLAKLKRIAKLTGRKKVSVVVRELIDSALPDADPNERFWRACANSGIFKMDIPASTVVPFIASFLELPLTANNKIDNIEIKAHAPSGLSPTLWALNNIREAFYEKSVSIGADKQGECEDSCEEQRGTEPDQS